MASNIRNMKRFFAAPSVMVQLSNFQERSKHARHFALLCGAILTALVQPIDSYANDEAALRLYDEGLRGAFRG